MDTETQSRTIPERTGTGSGTRKGARRRGAAGWWILPAALLGLGLWIVLIRGVF